MDQLLSSQHSIRRQFVWAPCSLQFSPSSHQTTSNHDSITAISILLWHMVPPRFEDLVAGLHYNVSCNKSSHTSCPFPSLDCLLLLAVHIDDFINGITAI